MILSKQDLKDIKRAFDCLINEEDDLVYYSIYTKIVLELAKREREDKYDS